MIVEMNNIIYASKIANRLTLCSILVSYSTVSWRNL